MNIVIVEDDINMRKSLEIALGEYEELNIKSYKSAVEALKKLSDDTDLIITDINMPKMDGLEFIKELNGKFDVIIMTGNATLNKAIESVRLGVKDFLTKPFDVSTLYEAIKRVETLKQKTPKSIKKVETKSENNGFLATSKALEATLNIALKAARTDASIMLSGESGVGKEVFAKFIHANSPRKDAVFVALNMAAIPENLIESELFGFEKGAFTDAATTKKGQFELANGGTLFLDEIGEMPINLQPKLLRALQERGIRPGIIAQDSYFKFLRIGMNCIAPRDNHTMRMIAAIMEPGDVIFAISHSGETAEILETVDIARARGLRIISLTENHPSSLRRVSDVSLTYIAEETPLETGSIASKMAQFFLVDLVYTEVLKILPPSAMEKKIRTTEAVRQMKL